MQRKAWRNPEIERHAAEKMDELNKARFRHEKGMVSPARPTTSRATSAKTRGAGRTS